MSLSGGPGPQLSSMAATLEDLVRRVTVLAEASAGSDDDTVFGRSGTRNISTELFQVEKSLTDAVRRITSITEALRYQGYRG